MGIETSPWASSCVLLGLQVLTVDRVLRSAGVQHKSVRVNGFISRVKTWRSQTKWLDGLCEGCAASRAPGSKRWIPSEGTRLGLVCDNGTNGTDPRPPRPGAGTSWPASDICVEYGYGRRDSMLFSWLAKRPPIAVLQWLPISPERTSKNQSPPRSETRMGSLSLPGTPLA